MWEGGLPGYSGGLTASPTRMSSASHSPTMMPMWMTMKKNNPHRSEKPDLSFILPFLLLFREKSKKKIETEKKSQMENVDGEIKKVKETEVGNKIDENEEKVKRKMKGI